VVTTADRQTRSILFTQLFNWTLYSTYSQLAPFWQVFLNAPLKEDEREGYLSVVSDNLEGLSYSYDDAAGLFRLFGDDVFAQEVLPRSMGDAVLCSFIAGIPEPQQDQAITLKLIKMIETVFMERPPRILFVIDRIRIWLRACDDDVARNLDSAIVETTRLAVIKKGSDQRSERRPFRATVRDWLVQGVDA
jgi:hypothetical protein